MFGDVEARRSTSPFIWYSAKINDLTEAGVLCSFEEGSWDDVFCDFKDVRLPAPKLAPEDFDPGVGDLVEYEVFATASVPGGWALAQVHARTESLWHLRWPERLQQCSSGEVLMPRSRLRPASRNRHVAGVLQKEEVAVDDSYSRWLGSTAAAAAFRRVECMAVGLQSGDARRAPTDLLKVHSATTGEPKVLAIGTKKAVERAKLLIPSILQNQEKVQSFEEALQTRDNALSERQARKMAETDPRQPASEGLIKDEFYLPERAVGRFIGKGGANIQAVQKEHKVKIVIDDAEAPGMKRVVMVGQNKEAVRAVRNDAELVERCLPVGAARKNWALGRNGTVCEMIQSASGLNSVRFDKDENSLVFEGTRSACAIARLLYDSHLAYFDGFQGLDETMEDLVSRLKEQGELRECIWPVPPVFGKGKSQDKGRGRGRGQAEARSVSPAVRIAA
mmetsp:Transcript_55028/g.103113  ORF Transcript_55028/g.103113 Transcript_55028/m.103113 type:complete len:449 (+) Transcript_55028:21-1367(+)